MATKIIRDFDYWLHCPAKILQWWVDHLDLLEEAERVALEAIEAFADEQVTA